MDKQELQTKILLFKDVLNRNRAEINVMLVDQNNQRSKKYRGYMLRATNDDIKSTVLDSLNFISEQLKVRVLDLYNLEFAVDESVEIVNQEDVLTSDEILGEITLDYNDGNVVSDSTNLDNVKFFVIQIDDMRNNNKIYLFTKYVHSSSAFKKSTKFTLNGRKLEPFNKEIITVGSYVTAFLMDGKFYIFNRNNFNSMFAYKDVFKKIIEANMAYICNSGLFINPEKLIEDCENDGRYLARLTKIILTDRLTIIAKDKESIPHVIEEFNIKLNIDNNGRIIYSGKEEIPSILNLFLQHCVIDAITSRKMIAAGIKKYTIEN